MRRGLSVFFIAFFCLCAVTGYAEEASDQDTPQWEEYPNFGGTIIDSTKAMRVSSQSRVRIHSIETGQEINTRLVTIPSVTVGKNITIKYAAIDLKAVLPKQQYRCRIKELDPAWSEPTEETEFRWTPEKAGIYTFEVQAIGSNQNYSVPASMRLKILAPLFYTRLGFIIGIIIAAFLILTAIYIILLKRRKKEVFEPIPNPYIVGEPIRSKDMFFGRRSDFEFIRIRLGTEESGMVIVFAGERKSGKTSILLQILNGELGERLVPVLLDMQVIIIVDETEFLRRLASEISAALERAGLETPNVDFKEEEPYHVFEEFISEAMEILGGKGLLLMFDEYEVMEAKIDSGILRPEIITLFADMMERHPRLSFIFTGSKALEQQKHSCWEELMEKSLYRRVGSLSEKSTLSLITEPVSDQVIYPSGIPEYILSLTAGHPFYTQMACQKLIDRLNEVKRNRVRQEDVDAVAQELPGS